MRFRLATKAPLRPLKAWFDIPNDNSVDDIRGVKSQICSRLPQLVDDNGGSVSPPVIGLLLDDFELLDDSSLDVIKENDLIHVTRKQNVSTSLKKRKAKNDYEVTRKKQRVQYNQLSNKLQRRLLPAGPDSSEGETSDSSETTSTGSSSSSSSSSSSESSSASSSSSVSSSSTSSSPSSAVEVQSSKLPSSTNAFLRTKNNSAMHHAPSGQGKPSTHSRNVRRRIKRLHEREQKQLDHAAKQSVAGESVNAIPLGTKSNAVTEKQNTNSEDLQAPTISPLVELGSPMEVENMVTALKNKNKKRGFKKAMATATPQKILFTDNTGTPPESSSTFYSTASATATTTTPRTTAPRLITPSEKQAQGLLPSNMFVTSVEVESESWDKKKKSKQRNHGNGVSGDKPVDDNEIIDGGNMMLNYGEPEIDWASIDKNWDNTVPVSDPSSLKAGTIVGWKALAINPTTFSPDMIVHLGRIKDLRHNSATIVLEPIRRPGSEEIAFGVSTIVVEAESSEIKGEAVEDEIYSFEDALKSPWKLVDI